MNGRLSFLISSLIIFSPVVAGPYSKRDGKTAAHSRGKLGLGRRYQEPRKTENVDPRNMSFVPHVDLKAVENQVKILTENIKDLKGDMLKLSKASCKMDKRLKQLAFDYPVDKNEMNKRVCVLEETMMEVTEDVALHREEIDFDKNTLKRLSGYVHDITKSTNEIHSLVKTNSMNIQKIAQCREEEKPSSDAWRSFYS